MKRTTHWTWGAASSAALLLFGCGGVADEIASTVEAIVIPPTGAYDVGIIPASRNACPYNSPYVEIHTDDEDTNNDSSTSGWTGAIQRDPSGTTFGFCKVNGANFQPTTLTYALLSLANACPPNSSPTWWHFDNENSNTQNSASGPYYPNQSNNTFGMSSGNTDLKFCVFHGTNLVGGGSVAMPNLYVPYGVFSRDLAPNPTWLASGHVHTDDEDNTEQDPSGPGSPFDAALTPIVYTSQGYSRKNSEFEISKVRADTCLSSCSFGSYDGSKCWVGRPPTGTTAFIYAGNFYYTPVNGNQCPRTGSWFDSQNCYVGPAPAGSNPTVVNNAWYVDPVCSGGPVSSCSTRTLTLSGPPDVCGTGGLPGTFTASMSGGGAGYAWSTIGGGLSVNPSGSTAQVTASAPAPTNGQVVVNVSVPGCGVYTTISNVTVNTAVPTIGPISGLAEICIGSDLNAYSVSPATVIDSFAWTVSPVNTLVIQPSGSHCTVGSGNLGVGGGAILKVTGQNACGVSQARSFSITVVSTFDSHKKLCRF